MKLPTNKQIQKECIKYCNGISIASVQEIPEAFIDGANYVIKFLLKKNKEL